MADIGHNSGGVVADELQQLIERIEQLNSEKADIAEAIRDIYAEAKGRGYDTPTIRKLVALRKRKPQAIREEREMLELYGSALGMDIFS